MTPEEVKRLKAVEDEVKTLRQKARVYPGDVAPKAVRQQDIDGIIIFRGLVADRPTNGDTEVQAYYAIDENILYLWDTGNEAWVGIPSIPITPQVYAASNVTTDRTYDANATTTDELADVLGTLIADLRSIGLVD